MGGTMTVRNINREGDPIEITGRVPKIDEHPTIYEIIERIEEGEDNGD